MMNGHTGCRLHDGADGGADGAGVRVPGGHERAGGPDGHLDHHARAGHRRRVPGHDLLQRRRRGE